MKPTEFLEKRSSHWEELEGLLAGRGAADERAAARCERLAFLYRAVCADLALAQAYDLPEPTIRYLHQLVARSHNRLYRSSGVPWREWAQIFFHDLPRNLRSDRFAAASFVVFWGCFLLAMLTAYLSPAQAEHLCGREQLDMMDQQYAGLHETGRSSDANALMMGFYVWHNTSIGLKGFASGLLFGVAGIPTLVFNGSFLGAVFGYMAAGPHASNFFTFVTAHGPFELTAVVLSSAAGMRIGWSLIQTDGYARTDALRRSTARAVPVVVVSVLFFILAALIEGFVSPSGLPYVYKAAVAVASTLLMLAYLLLGGRGGAAAGEGVRRGT